MDPKLSVNIGRLKLKNPVIVASGTFGYDQEFSVFFIDLKKLGAIVSKTITLKPRRGNSCPRTCETPAGLLNSVGLENPGIESFIKDKLVYLKKIGIPIVVSIASESDPEEFLIITRRLDKIKEVTAIELNISCPNILGFRDSGFGIRRDPRPETRNPKSESRTPNLISQDPKATYEVVKAVRKVTSKVLIAKLSPNVTDITEIAKAAESAGADAVSLINTLYGMSIDIETKRPKLGNIIGGLSGPAIRPVAVRMIWEVYQKIKIPIIGMGGITDTSSALEFFIAGSTAISVGTANFINPKVTLEIISGLGEYLQKNNISSIKNLTGSLECKK